MILRSSGSHANDCARSLAPILVLITIRAMRVKAPLSVCSYLLGGCLLFSCSSSSGGGIPPPAANPGAPLVDAGGTWSVQAVFTTANEVCAPIIGQSVGGLLFFTQNGTSIRTGTGEGQRFSRAFGKSIGVGMLCR